VTGVPFVQRFFWARPSLSRISQNLNSLASAECLHIRDESRSAKSRWKKSPLTPLSFPCWACDSVASVKARRRAHRGVAMSAMKAIYLPSGDHHRLALMVG
jgi:hypothetical protein